MEAMRLRLAQARLRQLESGLLDDPDDVSTILLSGHLRYLICDNELRQVWREQRFLGPFEIDTYRIAECDEAQGLAFCGGGAPRLIDLAVGYKSSVEAATIDLTTFSRMSRIQYGRIKIRCSELITYFANKAGGIHLDNSRKTKALDQKYLLIDALLNGKIRVPPMFPNGRHPVFHEIFSVAGALLKSRGAGRLLEGA